MSYTDGRRAGSPHDRGARTGRGDARLRDAGLERGAALLLGALRLDCFSNPCADVTAPRPGPAIPPIWRDAALGWRRGRR